MSLIAIPNKLIRKEYKFYGTQEEPDYQLPTVNHKDFTFVENPSISVKAMSEKVRPLKFNTGLDQPIDYRPPRFYTVRQEKDSGVVSIYISGERLTMEDVNILASFATTYATRATIKFDHVEKMGKLTISEERIPGSLAQTGAVRRALETLYEENLRENSANVSFTLEVKEQGGKGVHVRKKLDWFYLPD